MHIYAIIYVFDLSTSRRAKIINNVILIDQCTQEAKLLQDVSPLSMYFLLLMQKVFVIRQQNNRRST